MKHAQHTVAVENFHDLAYAPDVTDASGKLFAPTVAHVRAKIHRGAGQVTVRVWGQNIRKDGSLGSRTLSRMFLADFRLRDVILVLPGFPDEYLPLAYDAIDAVRAVE